VRIALSSYRSKPHSGGQGVYVRNLSRELVALGHTVEVFSGQPYPILDDGVRLTKVPSLDLYRPEDPFRRPAVSEFRVRTDVLEFATMCTGGFPEPRTFGRRLARLMTHRGSDFDILHDNQSLAPGLLRIARTGLPVLSTVHHPIAADRRVELAAASRLRKVSVARWYGFVRMQRRVAAELDHLVTVSALSAADIVADFSIAPDKLRVIGVGVDTVLFAPRGERVPGRLVSIISSDVATKGLPILLKALSRLGSGVSLIVVGTPSALSTALIAKLGIAGSVSFVSDLSDTALADLLASAQIAIVPSLYEGFSLPALEAMACATPVIASAVGALPELTRDGRAGVLVPAGDVGALSAAITDLMAKPAKRRELGATAREIAIAEHSWASVAADTAAYYAEIASV
jgi:glycosyltransferase involved in cell wall biosynthesis